MTFLIILFHCTSSLFAFGALILQLVVLIANTSNAPFLKDVYFARLTKNASFIDFGLWNSCNGTNNTVNFCNTPQPAFIWTNTTGLDTFVSPSNFEGYDSIFLANFILYWFGFILTLIALGLSIIVIAKERQRGNTHRRITSVVAIFSFAAFVVLLVVLCMMIVLSMRVINTALQGDKMVIGTIGPATWMTLGAMIGMLLGTIYYCCGCFFYFRPQTYNEV